MADPTIDELREQLQAAERLRDLALFLLAEALHESEALGMPCRLSEVFLEKARAITPSLGEMIQRVEKLKHVGLPKEWANHISTDCGQCSSAHERFHTIWTDTATRAPGYSKTPWRVLASRLHRAQTMPQAEAILQDADVLRADQMKASPTPAPGETPA